MDLYFDESGAGKSFLPGGGLTFVLASNNLSTSVAQSLKNEFFSSANELKYSDLKGSDSVTRFLGSIVENKHPFLFYSINKPYILLIVLIDVWIGQAGGQRNVEFYREGKAKQYAKDLYDELRNKLSSQNFYKIMSHLESMIKKYDEKSYTAFWAMLGQAPDSKKIEELLESEGDSGLDFYRAIFQNSVRDTMLSVPLTSLTRLVQAWQWLYPAETFSIHHDESGELLGVQKYWKERCSCSELDLAALHEAGLSGPLQVDQNSSSLTIDSKSCIQVQLSDIVAGAAADYLNARLEPNIFSFTKYHADLYNAGLFWHNAGAVIPVDHIQIQ